MIQSLKLSCKLREQTVDIQATDFVDDDRAI